LVKVNSNSIVLTEEGYERLSNKLEELKGKIKKNREDMKRTAANGDLSENAGYMAAKESYESNRRRIDELQDVVNGATVVSEEEIDTDRVSFGTRVKVKNLNKDKEFTYKIVGKHEARIEKREISLESPVAQGLIDNEPGDVVEVETPAGKSTYEIIDVGV